MKRFKKLMVIGAVMAIAVLAMSVNQAQALVHLWDIHEIFSNDDGTIQFIEMFNNTSFTGEGALSFTSFTTNANVYNFPSNLVGNTAFKKFLMATSGFAALPGAPTPDYIIPDNFFNVNGDTLTFVGGPDVVTFGPGVLPTDGVLSMDDNLTTGINSPTNFAGVTAKVVVPLADPIPETIQKGTIEIELQTIAVGLAAPVHLTHAGDGTNRLFVVDQPGQIRIIHNGILLKKPFLDVADRLVTLGFFGTLNPFTDFDERGILSVAFHPDFANPVSPGHQKIYTYTSEPNDFIADFTVPLPGGAVFDHQSVIAEWTVDASDPNMVDTATRREIMRIDQPQFNHDGGTLHFGPDGYLYISLGDGGAGNDVGDGHGSEGNGQNKDNVLGTILRIDPLHPSDTPASSDPASTNGAYRIPVDNPFVGTDGVDEIYAYGFRNPWRFSFDSVSGDLIVADVGQNLVEEIDIVTAGGNYGWNLKEGTFRFDPNTGSVSNDLSGLPAGLIDPNAQYDHDEGTTIIGGFIYHGTEIPELQGMYVFGDFSSGFFVADGRLFFADPANWEIQELILGLDDRDVGLYIKSIGEDADGELYVLAGTNLGPFGARGQVLKITSIACTPGQLHVIPGDVNRDCKVNFFDFALLALHWLECAEGPEVDCGI
jgi:glucose/arabinose dehydrogenase